MIAHVADVLANVERVALDPADRIGFAGLAT